MIKGGRPKAAAPTEEEWAIARNDWRQGETGAAIARRLEVSPAAVSQHMKKHAVKRDVKNTPREINKEPPRILRELEEGRRKLSEQVALAGGEAAQTVVALKAASTKGVRLSRSQLVDLHSKQITRLANIEQKLLTEVAHDPKVIMCAIYKGEITYKEVPLSLDKVAGVVKNLADVMFKRIAMERQAAGLSSEAQPTILEDAPREVVFRVVHSGKPPKEVTG